MSPEKILDLYFSRSDTMQTYWNFWITIALGLLGFFATVKQPRVVALAVAASFLVFARYNYTGLKAIAQQRIELCTALLPPCPSPPCVCDGDAVTIDQPVKVTLKPRSLTSLWIMHVSVDATVLGAILYMTRSK